MRQVLCSRPMSLIQDLHFLVTLLGVPASKIQDGAELSGLTPLAVPSSSEQGARMGRQEWEGECLKSGE